jgi:putative ABC transport system permease protein
MLRKSPTVTAAAMMTIALGVGMNTAIFSVVKSLLLDQLPFRDPARIVALSPSGATNANAEEVGGWTIDAWRSRTAAFESVASYGDGQLTLVENGQAEVLRGMRVSPEFFETLGTAMEIGRGFERADLVSRANVVVFNHDLWSRRFAADPGIVGRAIELNGESYRVIGVLPARFQPLRMTNPAELPQVFALAAYSAQQAEICRSCFGGRVIARLRPDVSAGQARAEVNAVMRQLVRERPEDYPRDASIQVSLLLDRLIGPIRPILWMLFGAVALVLLIACANVASLQLARASSRAREFAVRAALGSGSGRLAAQLLTENIMLAALGGVAGLLVGWLGTGAIVAFAPRELPRLDEIHVDSAVLLAAGALSVLIGIVFGVAPAWSAARTDLSVALKRAGGIAGGSGGARTRNVLVVADIALAFVLVAATGLLARSLANIERVDAGFDASDILTMTTTIAPGGYSSPSSRLDYYRRLVKRVRAVPGVMAAGMASNVPLTHVEPARLRIEGQAPVSDADAPSMNTFLVTPGYFEVLRIRLLRGRLLTDEDGISAPPAVVISESLARMRFPGADPIGRRIRLGSARQLQPWSVIVGVVGDVRQDALDRDAREAVYEPQAVNPFHYTRLLARTAGNPWRFERAIRAAMRDVDPAQTVFHVQPMQDYVSSSLADRHFTLAMIALFAALALLLSAVGVYGLVSHSVVQRTAEIGVRAALGARRVDLVGLLLRQGAAVAVVGLGLGLLASAAAVRLVARSLFGVAPWDLATFATTAAVLAAVVMIASFVPAREATKVDPMVALGIRN